MRQQGYTVDIRRIQNSEDALSPFSADSFSYHFVRQHVLDTEDSAKSRFLSARAGPAEAKWDG